MLRFLGRLPRGDAVALVTDPRSPAYIESNESRADIIEHCAGDIFEYIFSASAELRKSNLTLTRRFLLDRFETRSLESTRQQALVGIQPMTADDLHRLEFGQVYWALDNRPFNQELLVRRNVSPGSVSIVEPVSELALNGMLLVTTRSFDNEYLSFLFTSPNECSWSTVSPR